MENTLNKAVEKSMRRRFSQKHIRKCAEESALQIRFLAAEISATKLEAKRLLATG